MRDIIDVYIVKSNFFWQTVKLFFSEKKIFSENFFTTDSFSKSTLIDRTRIRLDSAHLNLRQETTVANKHLFKMSKRWNYTLEVPEFGFLLTQLQQ